MSEIDLDELTKQLSKTCVEEGGVSFQGKSLKLNSEDDAKLIIQEMNACPNLQYLNLEGNTLGVDAAKAIAKALESHSEFKRALWKDMFTGRMKTEIPKALQFLGSGLVLAAARLVELDLSDNAFGPIGVEGLASLLRSPPCFTLQVLKLNNNGLGITGGKLLSRALLECYNTSKAEGKPLGLQVFIAGRNRLENEGAKALAEVFKVMGTLEELSMPQNGIYHVGITALSEALMLNTNLRVMNFNDNTVTAKGAAALAQALPSLQNLQEINLGDCLLKTKGSVLLAEALADGHEQLEVVNLGFNEIGAEGARAIAEAMGNKPNLQKIELDGNQFGETGRQVLHSELKEIGKIDALGSLSEDEDEEDEGDDDDNEEEDDSGEESESDKEQNEENPDYRPTFQASPVTTVDHHTSNIAVPPSLPTTNGVGSAVIVLADFLKSPTAENFLALGNDRDNRILQDIQTRANDMSFLLHTLEILMIVSSLCVNSRVANTVLTSTNLLYQELFKWSANKDTQVQSTITNELMVHLGLLKSEWKFKPLWNLDGCWMALEEAIKQDFFPNSTKETLQLFLKRQVVDTDDEVQILN